jgi:hypothetical protein
MDIKYTDGAARVFLSRRNLEQLLVALTADPETAYLFRMTGEGMLYIFAEENKDHYSDRAPGPGFDLR